MVRKALEQYPVSHSSTAPVPRASAPADGKKEAWSTLSFSQTQQGQHVFLTAQMQACCHLSAG